MSYENRVTYSRWQERSQWYWTLSTKTYRLFPAGYGGYYSTVFSYRGEPELPLSLHPHRFTSYKVSLKYSVSCRINHTENGVVYAVSSGMYCGGAFGGSQRTSYGPDVNGSDAVQVGKTLASLVASKLFQKASEPYIPSITWMGELAETYESLKKPMKGLRTLGKKVKRAALNRSSRGATRNALRNNWSSAFLEYKFGIEPLIGMADQAAQRVAELWHEQQKQLKRHTAFVTETLHSSSAEMSIPFGRYGTSVWSRTSQVTVTARGAMIVKPIASTTLIHGGFRLGGVTSQAYALFPLSFLYNWGIDIDSLLKECRPIPGKVLCAYVTTIISSKHTYTLRSLDYARGTYNFQIVWPGTYTYEIKSTSRDNNIRRPGVLRIGSGIDSLGKAISLTALSGNFFRK